MFRAFRCDLHIHTCLSPCADLDMYPTAVVEKCIAEQLDIIAICDHNAMENVPFVLKSVEGKPLTVLPGMEITSSEEVHVLALFDNLDDLLSIQHVVYAHLHGTNREEKFGCQAIVNELDEVEGFNEKFLLGATGLPLLDIVHHIHRFDGLAIAAHIDRESFSVLGQLGFIDPEINFDAFEISSGTGIKNARSRYPELNHFPFVMSSDAHAIKDIGQGVTTMFLEAGTISELKMAFEHRMGRFIQEI
ncbi:MAG TPA: PHP domain-containing protein [Syntrophobacteraceae bacterium]|nr:PHP domain-containing protein [Syntrophobacteraceae bacterium]